MCLPTHLLHFPSSVFQSLITNEEYKFYHIHCNSQTIVAAFPSPHPYKYEWILHKYLKTCFLGTVRKSINSYLGFEFYTAFIIMLCTKMTSILFISFMWDHFCILPFIPQSKMCSVKVFSHAIDRLSVSLHVPNKNDINK